MTFTESNAIRTSFSFFTVEQRKVKKVAMRVKGLKPAGIGVKGFGKCQFLTNSNYRNKLVTDSAKLIRESPMNGWTDIRKAACSLIVLLFVLPLHRSLATPVLQTLHKFFPTNSAPQFPFGRLVEGCDGCFYGTTALGGSFSNGTVFKITSSGELTVLGSLLATNGLFARDGLMFGHDSNFYCTAVAGGETDNGTIFRVTTNGAVTRLLKTVGVTVSERCSRSLRTAR